MSDVAKLLNRYVGRGEGEDGRFFVALLHQRAEGHHQVSAADVVPFIFVWRGAAMFEMRLLFNQQALRGHQQHLFAVVVLFVVGWHGPVMFEIDILVLVLRFLIRGQRLRRGPHGRFCATRSICACVSVCLRAVFSVLKSMEKAGHWARTSTFNTLLWYFRQERCVFW